MTNDWAGGCIVENFNLFGIIVYKPTGQMYKYRYPFKAAIQAVVFANDEAKLLNKDPTVSLEENWTPPAS